MWLLSNKNKIVDSGLLEGFCDYHCHLLPGVDDGVSEMHETLEILERWEALGVTEVWLTPHIMEDIPNTTEKLKADFNVLCKRYKGSIRLNLAAENMMDNLLHQRLEEEDMMPMGDKKMHLLVETSYFNPPIDMAKIIDKVKSHGFVPVLAHPERYQYMDIGDYRKWKEKGVMMQINIPSIVGAYGETVREKALVLLEKGMYAMVGSDCHRQSSLHRWYEAPVLKKKTIGRLAALMAGLPEMTD